MHYRKPTMAFARQYAPLFALTLLIAGLCDAADYNILDLDFAVARKHEQWMAEHGRVYKSDAEKARGLEIFKDNLKYIEEFNNAGEYTYTLGLNQFADLTNEEFRAMYTGELEIPEEDTHRSIKYEVEEEPLHKPYDLSVNWTAKGAVGPIVNQGRCESCWAIASAAAIEGMNKIETGNFTSVSAQQLIDCDRHNGGCHKGYMTLAYRYVKLNGGITDTATYPFTYGFQEPCNRKKEKQVKVKIGGYLTTARHEFALARAVAKQPVSVAINTQSKSFQLYKSGIYNGPCGWKPDHAVVVVGYELKGKDSYWIVKNSWGTKWGEDGYFRMKLNVSSPRPGICGIAYMASYPTPP